MATTSTSSNSGSCEISCGVAAAPTNGEIGLGIGQNETQQEVEFPPSAIDKSSFFPVPAPAVLHVQVDVNANNTTTTSSATPANANTNTNGNGITTDNKNDKSNKNRNSGFVFPPTPDENSFLSFPSYFSSTSASPPPTLSSSQTEEPERNSTGKPTTATTTATGQPQNASSLNAGATSSTPNPNSTRTSIPSPSSLVAFELESSYRVSPNLANNYDYKYRYHKSSSSNDSVDDHDHDIDIDRELRNVAGSSQSHNHSQSSSSSNHNYKYKSTNNNSNNASKTNGNTLFHFDPDRMSSTLLRKNSNKSSRSSTRSTVDGNFKPPKFDYERFKKGSIEDLLERAPGLEEVIKNLQADGTHLWKVRSVSKWFRRRFTLDINDMSIRYEPTYKYNTCRGKEKRQIELGEIIDVRKGWKTDVFNAVGASEEKKRAKKPGYKSEVDERACFSIIYGPRQETLDLMAPKEEIADKWVRALNHLVSAHKSAEQEQSYEIWLRRKFNAADVDKNKCLSFPETMKLLKHLNITMEEKKARELFNEANVRRSTNAATSPKSKGDKGKASASSSSPSSHNNPEVLDEDEFVSFYFKLLQRPEIERIFSNYAEDSNFLSANALCQFLQKEQGDSFSTISVDEAKQLITIYEQAELSKSGQMSLSGFTNMLLSPKFDLFNQSHRTVWQDMTRPLADYFISASHNTYLIGNQLSGSSSVEGYVDAFKRGCRCVELDCWDGDDDEPIIYHGYTLTTKIRFKEVLSDAVKPYAFATSQYPIILGLENHCSEPYQKKMVEHLKNILGDMLYSEELDTDMEKLPSPEQLKCKVIIRGKKRSSVSSTVPSPATSPQKLKVDSPNPNPNPSPSPQERQEEEEADGGASSVPGSPLSEQSRQSHSISGIDDGLDITEEEPPRASMESLDESDDSDLEDSIDYIDGEGKTEKKKGVSMELSNLVNILQGVHFHSFAESKERGKPYHSSSFAESKALKLISESGADFVDFNKRQISKVFPAGSRTTSSNFNPMPYWTAGCQLVTLNMQTEDMPNFYNTAWFSENGVSGYVLKPEILRNPTSRFNPSAPLEKNQGVLLTVRVISGQHLPKAPGKSEVVDPYVEVKVIGLAQDKAKHQTKVIRNNGFNPLWDERFQFRVRCPDLSLLLFRVYDYSQTATDATLAHYGVPFSALTTGYRHVHLTSMRGTSLAPSSLFVHVNVTNMNAIK